MKFKSRSLIALLLCIAMLLCLASCKKNEAGEKTDTEDETEVSTENVPAVVEDEKDSIYVMNIGGNDISLSKYRYFFLNYKSQYLGDDESLLADETVVQTLRDIVEETLKYQTAIELLGKQENVIPSDEELKGEVDKILAGYFDYYEKPEDYYTDISSYYMTDALFRDLLSSTYIQEQLYNKLCGDGGRLSTVTDEEILDFVGENYVRVKHILINTEGLSDEDKQAKLDLAKSVLERAQSGEDFDALMKEFNEDNREPEIGYYYNADTNFVEEFKNAGFELSIGEVSDIVETDYGYHILKRYELDKDQILADEQITAYSTEYIGYRKFDEEIYAVGEDAEITYYDNFEELCDPKTLA